MIIPLHKWRQFRIELGVNGDTNVDPTRHTSPEEKVALDLTVGKQYWPAPGPRTAREVHKRIFIDAGKAVRIETLERFDVPDNVFGHVCSRTSHTFSGLVVANIKVDPKFGGHLHVTVYNVGTDRVELKVDDKFCSVFFEQLVDPVDGGGRHAPNAPFEDHHRVRSWYFRNRSLLVGAILGLLVSASGSWLVGHFDPPPTSTTPSTPTSVSTSTTTSSTVPSEPSN